MVRWFLPCLGLLGALCLLIAFGGSTVSNPTEPADKAVKGCNISGEIIFPKGEALPVRFSKQDNKSFMIPPPYGIHYPFNLVLIHAEGIDDPLILSNKVVYQDYDFLKYREKKIHRYQGKTIYYLKQHPDRFQYLLKDIQPGKYFLCIQRHSMGPVLEAAFMDATKAKSMVHDITMPALSHGEYVCFKVLDKKGKALEDVEVKAAYWALGKEHTFFDLWGSHRFSQYDKLPNGFWRLYYPYGGTWGAKCSIKVGDEEVRFRLGRTKPIVIRMPEYAYAE